MRASRLVFGVGWLLSHSASQTLGATTTTTSNAGKSNMTLAYLKDANSRRLKAAATVAVNQDGTAQFTSINDAIFYAQKNAIVTVTVAAGTYNEAILVNASFAVTIVGATDVPDDYTQNQVIISTDGVPLTINTNSVKGITWRNINFVTTSTSTTAFAVSMKGTKNAFYGCQIVSAGNQAFYSNLGITLIANSYVEAVTQTFAGFLGVYVFNSTITATDTTDGVILFNKGKNAVNSTVVFDSSTITQNTSPSRLLKKQASIGVYLAAPAGNYAQGVFKNSFLSDFINPQGVYNYPSTFISVFFGEFNNRGPGSFLLNVCARIALDNLLDSSQLGPFTVAAVFANSFSPYATTDLSWIDPAVLVAINAADAADATVTQSSAATTCADTSTGTTTVPTTTTTTVDVVTQSTTSTLTVGSSTVTPSPVTTTQVSTSTASVTSTVTVTPDPLSTRTSYTTVTTTVMVTSTIAAQTTTQMTTRTTRRTITSAGPGGTTTTTATVFVTGTITPAAATTTRTVATTLVPASTVTVTGRPVTKTVVILVVVRKTVVTTTTIGGRRAKRTVDARDIQPRAVSTVTVITTISEGSTTTTTTSTATTSVAGAVTLAPSTSTVASVSTTTNTITTTTKAPQGPRQTVTSTTTSTVSSTVTVTGATATVTSTATFTRDVTVTSPGPMQTSTVQTTATTQSTLPASTATNSRTLTAFGPAVTSTVPGPTVTSRTTETSTQVVTSTVTEYNQGGGGYGGGGGPGYGGGGGPGYGGGRGGYY